MSLAANATAFVLALLSAGCGSTPSGSVQTSEHAQPVGNNRRTWAYEAVENGAELAQMIRADLAEGEVDRAYRGVEAFALANVHGGRASRANEIFREARPILLFVYGGGSSRVTAVKEVGKLLEMESTGELRALYQALANDDLNPIRLALSTPGAPLHTDTLAVSTSRVPHAQFFDGVLLYDDLKSGAEPSAAAVSAVVERMQRAGAAFARTGQGEPYFLSLVVAAEALELGGAGEEAMEHWLTAIETDYWRGAGANLRVAVAGRVESYRSRLRGEVETAVADERRREIERLEAAHRAEHAEALQRIAKLETTHGELLAALRQAQTENARLIDGLDEERARRAAASEVTAEANTSTAREATSLLADVLTIWGPARALARL
ncbi:MAG: hypothetical protein GY711_16800 [bacterium]|nr:hypothetical protein [bacterium]